MASATMRGSEDYDAETAKEARTQKAQARQDEGLSEMEIEGGAPSADGSVDKRRDDCASHPSGTDTPIRCGEAEGRGRRTSTTKPDLSGDYGELPLAQNRTRWIYIVREFFKSPFIWYIVYAAIFAAMIVAILRGQK